MKRPLFIFYALALAFHAVVLFWLKPPAPKPPAEIAINTDEAKNLRSLAQTYSTLTPHAAVAIIREMDDTTVVKILSLMKPDVVGPIFEEMAGASGGDTSLAQHAAVLSDKLRLMKSAQTSGPLTAN